MFVSTCNSQNSLLLNQHNGDYALQARTPVQHSTTVRSAQLYSCVHFKERPSCCVC